MQRVSFQLIVRPDENSLRTLKYIDRVIHTLNAMGVKIKIKKLSDKDMTEGVIKALQAQNITRLPVIITNDDKRWVGYKDIKMKFDRNITEWEQYMMEINKQRNQQPTNVDIEKDNIKRQKPSQDLLENYMHDELNHLKKVGEKYVFDDAEEENVIGESTDYRKAMERQNQRRAQNMDRQKPIKGGSLDDKLDSIRNDKPNSCGIGDTSCKKPTSTKKIMAEHRELNDEDRDVLNKIGGGDFNAMDGYDDNIGEEDYKKQALASFGGMD